MDNPTPAHLETTLALVRRAYPHGVPIDEYLALLFVLSDHMCEENLAMAASYWRDVDGSRLNDVLTAIHEKPNATLVIEKLRAVGLEHWIAEEEPPPTPDS
jgi:hypothetical protein